MPLNSISIFTNVIFYFFFDFVEHYDSSNSYILSTSMTMSYYLDPNYFQVWSKLTMPGPGPLPASFFFYSMTLSFIIGLLYGFVYLKVNKLFQHKSTVQKGLRYGSGLILVSALSSMGKVKIAGSRIRTCEPTKGIGLEHRHH